MGPRQFASVTVCRCWSCTAGETQVWHVNRRMRSMMHDERTLSAWGEGIRDGTLSLSRLHRVSLPLPPVVPLPRVFCQPICSAPPAAVFAATPTSCHPISWRCIGQQCTTAIFRRAVSSLLPSGHAPHNSIGRRRGAW